MRAFKAASLPRGFRWIIRDPSTLILSTSLLNIGLRLVSNIVLAHLLMPHAFGLVSIASLVAIGLAMVTDIGVWLSIVRKKDFITEEWLRQL